KLKYLNRLSHEMCDLARLQAMENRLLRMIQTQEVQRYTLNWRWKRLIMTRRLGKGLDALISDMHVEDDSIQDIPIRECRPNPHQTRKTFAAEGIDELKESILQYGIIQPLIVRKSIKGYEIVVGERRFRAAKEAGLDVIPAIVKELSDGKMMELALLENLQREDLTPIE